MRRMLILGAAFALPLVAQAGLIKGNLKKKDVASIAFDAPSYGLCPGAEGSFELVATLTDGKALSTKGDIVWDAYDVTTDLGTLGKRGHVSLPLDPRATWGKKGTLNAVASDHPDKTTTAALVASYACAETSGWSGAGGSNGPSGNMGSSGNTGGAGGSGGAGGPGQDGGRGPDLDVWVKLAKNPVDQKAVVQVKVENRANHDAAFYALDPELGTLLVQAAGGPGGYGGRGGVGGTGGSAPSGGASGAGGPGGPGGPGGNGGPGGTITVHVTKDAQPYMAHITLHTPGGQGGGGGDGGDGGSPGSYAGGVQGPSGSKGSASYQGRDGAPGPAPVVTVSPVPDLF